MAAKRGTTQDKNYLELAKKTVHRPADITAFWKILVYGRYKKGKTKFGLSAGTERTLVIDPEKGTDKYKHLNPYVWPLNQWSDMQEAWGAIRTYELSPKVLGLGDSDEPFDTFFVDGGTKINNMALRHVMRVEEQRDLDRRPGMVDRRDYNKSGELMKDMINNFLGLKANVIFAANERMMTASFSDDEEEEVDSEVYMVPDLPPGVRGSLNAVVDVIGRLYTVRVTGKTGKEVVQRRLQIGDHERYDTGYRSDFVLPDVLKRPTFPRLVKLLETGEA